MSRLRRVSTPAHTANRTIVEYKDIWSGAQLDPNGTANGGAGLFRDPVYGPGTPENSLSGTIFTVDDSGTLDNISIPASMSQLRFWANTSIASGNGGTLTNLLGYEWDSDLNNGFRPAGLIDLSSTTKTSARCCSTTGRQQAQARQRTALRSTATRRAER